MITLKLNNYNDEDVKNLRTIFAKSLADLQLAYDCKEDCQWCDAETVCTDLKNCAKYLENLRKYKRG